LSNDFRKNYRQFSSGNTHQLNVVDYEMTCFYVEKVISCVFREELAMMMIFKVDMYCSPD